MVHDEEKLALDTQTLHVHLTGLQAEVEAKIRRVRRFRDQMKKLDAAPLGKANVAERERAARALLQEIDAMLATNSVVRDMLHELREAAEAVLADLL